MPATSTADGPGAAPASLNGGLPPGPRTPALAQVLQWGADPYGYMRAAQRRYGDAFTARIIREPWVVLAHPDAVREVMGHGPDDLNSGEPNQPLRPVIGTRSVLLLDGSEHLRRRRVVLPPFHGERMTAYAGIVEEAAARELATWAPGRPTAVLPSAQAITFEVILRAVFGVDDAARLAWLGSVLRGLLAWVTDWRRALVFGFLGPERIMSMRTFRGRQAAVDDEVLAEIRRRRGAEDLEGRSDVLSILLEARDEDGDPLSDRDLRDELVTLLVAGHETTAALIAWASVELARAPEIQERLAAGEEGLADAVVTEALRLRPPVPLFVRRLRVPLRIAGLDLPAGATLAPCALLVHRRPDLYPEPDAFRPGRFLGARPPAGGWFPFGGGVRRCIGAAFAQFEARLVLEEICRRFVLAPGGTDPERVGRRGIVLVPRRGGRVIATSRAGAAPLGDRSGSLLSKR